MSHLLFRLAPRKAVFCWVIVGIAVGAFPLACSSSGSSAALAPGVVTPLDGGTDSPGPDATIGEAGSAAGGALGEAGSATGGVLGEAGSSVGGNAGDGLGGTDVGPAVFNF